MTIKSLLCLFSGALSEWNALDTAFILACDNHAHLRILHISPDTTSNIGLYPESMMIADNLMKAYEKENNDAMKTARQYALTIAAKHHYVLSDKGSSPENNCAAFIHLEGDIDSIVASEGRLSDLIIIGRSDREPNAFFDKVLLAAIFNTGRPVLLAPAVPALSEPSFLYRQAAIAWDGSLEAARALYNIIPLLTHVQTFYVLTTRADVYDAAAEDDLMKYLKNHHIHAEFSIIDSTDSTGKALLDRVISLQCNFLVMGAYGHSRFREVVLGGVTDYMLTNASLPLILSH